MRLPSSPLLKGLLGGVLGTLGVLVLAGLVLAGLTLYRDHQVLQAVVQVINRAQASQTPSPRGPASPAP